MAVEKVKVLAYLDEKYKGKGTKAFRDKYAERWSQKIDKDEDIPEFVEDRAADFLEAVAEGDRRATQAAQTARAEAAKAAAGEDGKSTKTETDTDALTLPEGTPDYMKQVVQFMQNQAKQMENVMQAVTGLQQAKTTETLNSRFEKDERLAGIPKELLFGRYPQKAEDYDSAVEAAATALKPYIGTGQPAKGLGLDKPGGGATKPAVDGKQTPASKEQLDAVMSNL